MGVVQASRYTVYPDGYDLVPTNDKWHWTLSVELRNPEEGLWAVSNGFDVYSKSGEESDPLPSSRSEDHLAQTRFPLEEAIELAQSIVNVRKCNGYSFPMLIEKYKDLTIV